MRKIVTAVNSLVIGGVHEENSIHKKVKQAGMADVSKKGNRG